MEIMEKEENFSFIRTKKKKKIKLKEKSKLIILQSFLKNVLKIETSKTT